MRYQAAIRTNSPETLVGLHLQPGQWIDYNGTRGRWVRRYKGVDFIAWGKTATHRFQAFTAVAFGRWP